MRRSSFNLSGGSLSRPLYITSRGNPHREHYAHLQRLRDITQVWPELEIRWESDEDQKLYSERESTWIREVSVGRLCKTCTRRWGVLAGHGE